MCVLSSRLQLHIYFFHYLLRILKICILLYLSDRIYENTLCYYHFLTLIIHRQKLEWKLNNLSFAKCFRLRGKKWLVANAIEQLSSIKRIYCIASPAQRRQWEEKEGWRWESRGVRDWLHLARSHSPPPFGIQYNTPSLHFWSSDLVYRIHLVVLFAIENHVCLALILSTM